MELYPHQKKALSELHNGAILCGDVGTGKSLTAIAYYLKNEAPKDVIVITTAKKRDSLDWVRDFASAAVGTRPDATVHGVLTVDSWNNLGNYLGREGCFFIFDEQRVVGNGKWSKAFIHVASHNRWILLSATPGDTWLDYVPAFIANGFYRNRTEFQREHVVYARYAKFPKVERYVGVGKLVRLRNQILVEMPYTRLTRRHTTKVPVQYDAELQDKVLKRRWHVFENRPLKDAGELFHVLRKVVNSDTSRTRAVLKLLERHPKLIVFYNNDYELANLRELGASLESWSKESGSSSNSSNAERFEESTGESAASGGNSPTAEGESWQTHEPTPRPVGTASSVGTTETESDPTSSAPAVKPSSLSTTSSKTTTSTTSTTTSGSSFQLAEWNGHKHQPIPGTDRWLYLVQYVAGSEGWNCVETDAMCFYSLTYSYKNWHQAHGRIDRLNTKFVDLYYYILLSNSVVDHVVLASLKEKKNFNELKYRKLLDTRSDTGYLKSA